MNRSLILLTVVLIGSAPRPETDMAFRLAFGSCNRTDLPQPLWPVIADNEPHVWIWLGDNVYGDTLDMNVLRAKYDAQKKNSGYRRLASMTEVVGIWDDHDYGQNDAGKEYPMKKESQQSLLDFLSEPEGSPRRNQEGVYASYEFRTGKEEVKVILLDCRYHRDPPGPNSDILGETQWQWLEAELRNSDAQVNIVGSSIQVIPTEHKFEKWGDFPTARNRLFEVIRDSGAKGVLFISGDRHQAEISRLLLDGMSYPIYEVTASGLTHVAIGNEAEPNRHRVAGPVAKLNFGLITIELETKPVMITLEVRGLDNKVLIEDRIRLNTLK